MLNTIDAIFERDDVKKALEMIVQYDLINEKDIPNRINGEKITHKEYSVYSFLDAIIKYAIIIDDIELFDNYIEKLHMIFNKLDSHNEINAGITKLIIKTCGHKFGIEDYENIENKKIIVEYIYEKYINNGYIYHAFPYIFKDEVEKNGLNPQYYYHSLNELKEVNQILVKYNIDNTFSKEFDNNPYLSFTDSFFMASFYANNSPLYLQELCENIYGGSSKKKFVKDGYVLRDYYSCVNNIDYVARYKEMTTFERDKITNFFNNEWNSLKIKDAKPVVAFVKRSIMNKDDSLFYTSIIKDVDQDLFTMVDKIFSIRFNKEKIEKLIDHNSIKVACLPSVCNLYQKENEKLITTKNKSNDDLDQYGNISIIALAGVLLITLGVTLMIIMLGQ